MSVVLAHRWGIDLQRVLLAALLHDLAKPYPKNVQRKLVEKVTIFPMTEEDREHSAIWHGLISAQEAHDRYGVEDEEVLEAIAFHPTGQPEMRPVGMAVYVADFMEPSRSWPGVEPVRREIGSRDMLGAARLVAEGKLTNLNQKGRVPHSRTRAMLEWLDSKNGKGDNRS
ncbi:bis(5'-nucleosyl)-tetraphosphatase (symmetrical) YqeK [bacterium]|nr:bis(5'-nucleosyl)-tetraphosphatase (symmetrical) YqeK [bacterium]